MKVRTIGQHRFSNKEFSESLNYFMSYGKDGASLTINHDDKKLEIKLSNDEVDYLVSTLIAQINERGSHD